jgi:hypothetical protein
MCRSITIVTIIIVVALCCFGQTSPPISEPTRHFLKGKQLVENNCIDCQGGTQAGTEEGIRELQAAIDGGYSDQLGAYKLLSDAYGDMSTYVEHAAPKQSEAYWAKKDDAQRKLYQLDPKDPEIAEGYARTLKTDEQRIPVLRKILEANPDRPAFWLGTILVNKGSYEEGIGMVRNAIMKETDPEGVRTYFEGLIDALQKRGCPISHEQQWMDRINAASAKAIAGPGDPVAIEPVKQQFLDALRDHKCATGAAK